MQQKMMEQSDASARARAFCISLFLFHHESGEFSREPLGPF